MAAKVKAAKPKVKVEKVAKALKAAKSDDGEPTSSRTSASGEAQARPRTLLSQPAKRAADVMSMASDGTRLIILNVLRDGPQNVGAIVAGVGGPSSQPAISHHLALLKGSGVVTAQREGKCNFYELTGVGTALLGCVDDMIAALKSKASEEAA